MSPLATEHGKELLKVKITIRNVDETTAKVLSHKAAKAGMSRQEYLLMQLNRMASVDAFMDARNEYATLVKNIAGVIAENTEQLQRFADCMENFEEREGIRHGNTYQA